MKNMFKFHRKCQMQSNSLLHQAYMEARNLMTPWCKFLKCILTKVGVQDIGDDYDEDVAFCKLSEVYKIFWKNSLFNDIRPGNMGNKLRTYRLFKSVYECEPYLHTVSDFKTRQCITKL